MVEKKMIPPDGGWGWVIAVAYGLNNVIMVPILQGFSLVLKDVFKNLNIPGTDTTVILSVNSAFGMGVGLLHGPLLRKFGYRKIALIGSLIFTIGITMTAFATNFTHFMITYGLMASFGVGLAMSAFSLAVNTYFVEKRGRAVGMAMTFTGLGPILMPQLTSYLMSSYGTQGTIIILGGLTLHSLVGTALLQPVKWHATWKVVEPENEKLNPEEKAESKDSIVVEQIVRTENEIETREDLRNCDAEHEKSNRKSLRRVGTSANEKNNLKSRENVSPHKWWNSGKSLESINLGSSAMIFDEDVNLKLGPLVIEENSEEDEKSDNSTLLAKETPVLTNEKSAVMDANESPHDPEKLTEDKKKQDKLPCWKKVLRAIVRFFDFDLLRDPIYVNMMLGMSIALFAEINFAILTPLILDDMGFNNDRIANIMSTLAGVDLVSRGVIPFIGEWLKLPARHLALISLFLLICCRTMLMITRNFAMVILIAVGLGFAKGIRSVNMSLVIPNYIPIERLASATGIQMVVNGIVLMILGPLLGLSKDKFGSYVPSLILINSTTALTIVMWVTEMCIVHRRRKTTKRNDNCDESEAPK